MADHSYNIDFNNIYYSYENYDSTMAPFFRPAPNNDLSINNTLSIIENNNITIINEFKILGLEKNINDFFLDHEAYNKEIYINEYTFFSIKKILDLYEYYKNENINNIIDIGFIYQGMGWIKVIYYNTKFNKLFFRMDGGSNDLDRLDNYNNMKKLSKLNNIELLDTKAYSFKEILNL
tara:strand:+ start:1041 stop:1574 length:534 start_codon:yes stop_codon:yes gene_type:complete